MCTTSSHGFSVYFSRQINTFLLRPLEHGGCLILQAARRQQQNPLLGRAALPGSRGQGAAARPSLPPLSYRSLLPEHTAPRNPLLNRGAGRHRPLPPGACRDPEPPPRPGGGGRDGLPFPGSPAAARRRSQRSGAGRCQCRRGGG